MANIINEYIKLIYTDSSVAYNNATKKDNYIYFVKDAGIYLGSLIMASHFDTSCETDPTVPTWVKAISQADITKWNTMSSSIGDLTLATVAITGEYEDLLHKPDIPKYLSDLTNDIDAVSDASYVHTDNNYTTLEKDYLASLFNYDDSSVIERIEELEAKEEEDPKFFEHVASTILDTSIDDWNSKQPFINDLDTIRANASLGATALLEVKTVNGNDITGTGNVSVGTVTGIIINGSIMGSEGVVDLGTLIRDHQNLSLYANGAEYDSTEHMIYLKNGNTRLANPIDAADFIKDGMVNDVSIRKGTGDNADLDCLVITFNTDAGLDNIELPLNRIFNPNNYYTKDESDDRFLQEETDPKFFEHIASSITEQDINYWNAKQEAISDASFNYWNAKQEAIPNASFNYWDAKQEAISNTSIIYWNEKQEKISDASFNYWDAKQEAIPDASFDYWNAKQEAISDTSFNYWNEKQEAIPDASFDYWNAKQEAIPNASFNYWNAKLEAISNTSILYWNAKQEAIPNVSILYWNAKLNAINDISTIRANASLGATALQYYIETDPTVPEYIKDIRLYQIDDWNSKQPFIEDLDTIRANASLGATALLSFTETDPTVALYIKDISTADIANWNSKTDNIGTITEIIMNSSSMGTDGVVDLGTVITEHQHIKTINGNDIVGDGSIYITGLPQVTAADNGKMLVVVNGEWQLMTPVSVYVGDEIPLNTFGNNGDIFLVP